MEEVHKYERKTDPHPPSFQTCGGRSRMPPHHLQSHAEGLSPSLSPPPPSPRPGRQGRGGGDSPKPSAKHAPDVGDGHKIIKKVRDWHHGHHEDHARKCLVQAFGGEAHFQEKVAQPEELRPSFITRSHSCLGTGPISLAAFSSSSCGPP